MHANREAELREAIEKALPCQFPRPGHSASYCWDKPTGPRSGSLFRRQHVSTCPAKHRERVFAALRPLIERLEAEVRDWRDAAQRAAGETCGDERHCTCVAPLRAEVERLSSKLSRIADAAAEELLRLSDAEVEALVDSTFNMEER